jgi:hypothetical protein
MNGSKETPQGRDNCGNLHLKTLKKKELNMKQAQVKKILSFFLLSSLFVFTLPSNGYCDLSCKLKKEVTRAKDEAIQKAVQVKDQAVNKIEKVADRDAIKHQLHKATDKAANALSPEKIHQSIDQMAEYFDKEKMKATVDEVANYFDPEKLKATIDFIAERVDREQIKDMIDLFAEAVNRDKLKETVDYALAYFNKDQIKQTVDQSVDWIADTLQDATQSLQQEISALGNNTNAIYDVIQKHNLSRWVTGKASYGPATLSNLKLGGLKKSIAIAKPGEHVDGEIVCAFDRSKCSALSLYRVVLGIKDVGGQTTVFNHFGLRAGKETDHFTLTAPKEKGVYQVGFRVVEAAREETALRSWDNAEGEPVTIGLLIVV